jgi:hypothetical protein
MLPDWRREVRDFTFDLRTMPYLWIPGPLPGMNEIIEARMTMFGRVNPAKPWARPNAYSKMKKDWCAKIGAVIKESRHEAYPPGHVNLFCFERDNRRDFDNVTGGATKIVLDSLVEHKLLSGDGRRVVLGVGGWVDVDKAAPGVAVIVTHGRRADTDEALAFIDFWKRKSALQLEL